MSMNDDEGPRIGQEAGIAGRDAAEEFDRPGEGESSPGRGWDCAAEAEEICEQILERRPELQERELWCALADYRLPRVAPSHTLGCAELASADREKLQERIRLLIGRLPAESLEDFCGLVAFTQTFLRRVEFVCDLVVYLFAEREKGLESEGIEGGLYLRFFSQKLMWELDVLGRIAERHPLSVLADEYLDWLTDRILDGEVLI